MRKFRFIQVLFLSVLILGWGVFLTSCREQTKPVETNQMSMIPEVKGRELEVLMASPQGTTEGQSEADTIVVAFNQPMVPLEQLSQDTVKAPLELTPQVPGKYRWLGTSTLSFIPENKLTPATKFTAKVPAGALSLSGMALKADYQWEFETVRPGVESIYPGNEEQRWLRLDQKFYLAFNLPMNPDKAKPFIRLLESAPGKNAGETELAFNLTNLTKEDAKGRLEGWKAENTLVIEPDGKLKIAHQYRLELQKDLPALEGNLGMKEEQVFSFSTFDQFVFLGMNPENSKLKPGDELTLNFSNPVSAAQVVKHISFRPPVKIPEGYSESSGEESAQVYLDLDFKAATTYTMTIAPDLQDKFANSLGKKLKVKFTTGDYAPNISMATGFGLLESYGSLSYPVEFVNLKSVRKRILLLNRESVVPFLEKADIENDAYYSTTHYSGPFTLDQDWHLNLPENQNTPMPIDLKPLLGDRKEGLLYLQLLDKDPQNYRSVFIQSTNLGITGKFSPENNLIWVTRLKDTKPVEGAKVEIRDKKNRVLWSGKTDSSGLAQTPGWAKLGLSLDEGYYMWKGPDQWVLASQGRDLAVLSSQWSVGVDPWDFNIDYEGNTDYPEVNGYLFTERGLYLPGDQVHIKGVLRKKNLGQWQAEALQGLYLSIYNSRDEKIFSRKVGLSDYGSFDYTYQLPAGSPTGYYKLRLLSAGKKAPKIDISRDFQVQAFKPAQFEVNLSSGAESFIPQDKFKAEISGWYLIGAPMGGEKTEWSLRLENGDFRPAGFEDYSFGMVPWWGDENSENDEDEGSELAFGKGVLDARGKLTIEEALHGVKLKHSMNLVMEATVNSVNRQSVSENKSWPLHPGEYYIGIKLSSGFVPCAKPVKLDFLSVSPEGKIKPGQEISVEIARRTWNSVRKYVAGGNYEWVSEKKDIPVFNRKLRTASQQVFLSYAPDQPGEYVIKASGQDRHGNSIYSETYFYAWGAGYVPWERGTDDRIDLISDKQQYQPGDKARIMIKSPYERACALVTIEREYVMERFVTEVAGSASTIEIPLTQKSLPNVYVSVILLQGRKGGKNLITASQDLGKPGFKLGYINLKVIPDDKRLKVVVKTDRSEYRPDDQVTVDLQVNDYLGRGVPAEVCLSAVDIGVLNLIKYATPNPFDAFYSSRPLQVTTSELRYYVIGERNYGEKGSQGGGGGIGKTLENLYRKNFKTTPCWKPALKTDERGHVRITFRLPENLTGFRVMAVAQTLNSCFGSGEQKITVNKPLMLKPSLPGFARLGDVFQAGVVVHNGGKDSQKVTVTANAQGLTLLEPKIQTVSLEKGEEKEVRFNYRVEQIGTGKFYFQARAGKESDGFITLIPLKENRPWEKVALFNDGTLDRQTQKITVPAGFRSGLEISLASTALVQLKSGLDYVIVYPHDCLEQRSSKIFPLIMGQDLVNALEIDSFKGEELRRTVQDVLAGFKNYQLSNGGFDIWTPPQHEYPYAGVYALEVLARAKEHGYQVDREVVKKGLGYLKKVVHQETKNAGYSEDCDLSCRCYALYVRSLFGEDEPAYLNLMYEKRSSLPLFARAMLLKALHHYGRYPDLEDNLAAEFMNLLKISPSQAHFEETGSDMEAIYSSNVRTTAIVLQALLEVRGQFAYAPRIVKWLLLARRNGRWENTQDNVFVFSALTSYFKLYEKTVPDFTARVKLDNQTLIEGVFQGRTTEVKNQKVSLSRYKAGETLTVNLDKSGKGRLYYGLGLSYLAEKPAKPRDEGLLVLKTIEPLEKGRTPQDSYLAGDTYLVTLRVLTPQERLFVAVDDPVPAGFEVVNTSFATESQALQRRMASFNRKKGADKDRYWWGGTFNHWEIYDDRVLLFADRLSSGEHIFTYMMKAFHYGRFCLPATKAEEMYTPEVFGNTGDVYTEIK